MFSYKLIDKFYYIPDKKSIPKELKKGIYFFIQDYKIKYIGSTMTDLKSRIAKHKKYEGEQILFFEMGKFKDLVIKRLEKSMILFVVPPKNNMSKYDKIR
jgi:hypothetical protein